MRVKVEDALFSGRAASPTRATSGAVVTPGPELVSPLTSIRAVRTQLSALESSFKFPPVLDFDHSELAVTSNNAPVRAYEQALNDLLERLDAIGSDGNEEVRDVRREVVREVERALEEVERKVKGQAPQGPVPEVTKEGASGVESEGPGASATQDVPPPVAHVAGAAKPTLPSLTPVVSQTDADVDVAISAEYKSATPVAGSLDGADAELDDDNVAPPAPAIGEASTLTGTDTEHVPASEDASDSITTITPARVAPAVPVPSPSNQTATTSATAAESFLTSLSSDQFTFPPRPAFSQSSTGSGVSHDDDAVLVDNSSESGSVRGVEDEWTTEF